MLFDPGTAQVTSTGPGRRGMTSGATEPTRKAYRTRPTMKSLSHSAGASCRGLDAGPERDAGGVAGEIAPQEAVAEDQRAGPRVPDRVDPRRVIELTHFDRARTRERGDDEARRRPARRKRSPGRRIPSSRRACRRRRSRPAPAAMARTRASRGRPRSPAASATAVGGARAVRPHQRRRAHQRGRAAAWARTASTKARDQRMAPPGEARALRLVQRGDEERMAVELHGSHVASEIAGGHAQRAGGEPSPRRPGSTRSCSGSPRPRRRCRGSRAAAIPVRSESSPTARRGRRSAAQSPGSGGRRIELGVRG